MIYRRDYAKRRAISYNDAALWQTYRTLRNMVTSTVRRKKKLYYDSKITDCQSNPKQLWNVIGQLTGRKQFDNIPADLSANDFNEYFSSIGSETVAHLLAVQKTQLLLTTRYSGVVLTASHDLLLLTSVLSLLLRNYVH